MKTEYSKETLKLAAMTWNADGTEVRSTNVLIGETYNSREDEKAKYKITEDTYDELVEYQDIVEKKFRVTRNGKILTLLGLK